MKKLLKTLLLAGIAAMLLCALFAGAAVSGAASADPADSYTKQNATYEDTSIKLWFEHSFNKVFTSDKTSSGMNTYSIYMAKNEIENAQFVLYSASTKTGMSASITDFKNSAGDTVPAEIYYEMYVTTSEVRKDFVLGATSSKSIIREGETPDPIVPLSNLGTFQLTGGKSQAFLIRAKSSETTPSGWYSAQLDIKNSSGQVVKTATVFCYVWDFVISEETEFKTAMFVNNTTSYGGSYQKFYDYLLENRLVGMDVPGGLTESNPYLTNPRVNAIRVTNNGGGANGSYGEAAGGVEYSKYRNIYNTLSNSDDWNEIKDKFYFYIADEPVGEVMNIITRTVGVDNLTVDDINEVYSRVESYWPDAKSIVPYHQNHPYPYFKYEKALSTYADYQLKDSTQALLDAGSISIWCPQTYAFTPQSELTAAGCTGLGTEPIIGISGPISGLYSYGTNNTASGTFGVDITIVGGYYNWEKLYGEYKDRVKSEMALSKANGSVANSEYWAYCAGSSGGYTYANHLIENTGLQTKMMFWQFYQEDVTGYLYYGTNSWTESDASNGNYVDKTVTGGKSNCTWKPNKYYVDNYACYGNGVLFYGPTMARVQGIPVVGTIRVEIMRDGIEDYQMFKMLESYKGEKAAKDIVKKVSKNVVNYLSLSNFSTSSWSSSMDEYDIMASVRKTLGNQVEAAAKATQCKHKYNSGTVTTAATCVKMGVKTYTCTKCSASYTEDIPALHTVGNTFVKQSGTAATCTKAGSEIYKCSTCGYRKTVETPAHHDNPDLYTYTVKNDTMHNVVCTKCNTVISGTAHVSHEKNTATCTKGGVMISTCRYCSYSENLYATNPKAHDLVETHTAPTCTEPGVDGYACTRCSYTEGTVTKATGHKYGSDNVCTECGDVKVIPPYVLGDINDDGQISAKDLNLIKKYLAGSGTLTENQQLAADVTEDGRIAAVDMNLISRYIAGVISEF